MLVKVIYQENLGFNQFNIIKRYIICFIPHIAVDEPITRLKNEPGLGPFDPLRQLKNFIVSSINFKLVKNVQISF